MCNMKRKRKDADEPRKRSTWRIAFESGYS